MSVYEAVQGMAGFGLMAGVGLMVCVYLVAMVMTALKFVAASRSYIFTKIFGDESHEKRGKLQERLVEYGMTYKQAADCMNGWGKKS